jgi:DNA-directed RNA polymerase beta subunit
VFETRTKDGAPAIKSMVRATRTPAIGDKFSSRHGQKGVLSVLYTSQNLPFLERSGVSPTMIINPHAIPSRMTIGKTVEGLVGKASVIEGCLGDGTPFCDVSMGELSRMLAQRGRRADGTEFLIDPNTGLRIEEPFYVMDCYYQRLKHLAREKRHARARGPVQLLVRQPVEGRARQGGGKLGEMERDCMIAHGAAQFLHERLFELSDPYVLCVCSSCGLAAEPARADANYDAQARCEVAPNMFEYGRPAGRARMLGPQDGAPRQFNPGAGNAGNNDNNNDNDDNGSDLADGLFRAATNVSDTLRGDRPYCRNCRRSDTVREVELPYTFKLFYQELMGCNIALRFRFDDSPLLQTERASGDGPLQDAASRAMQVC